VGEGIQLGRYCPEVGADRDATLFEKLADVYLPFTPGFQCQQEAASGNCFVSHVAGGFGDETICPGEDVVEKEFVDFDDIVVAEDAKSRRIVLGFADFDASPLCKVFKHFAEIFVYTRKECKMEFASFEKR